MDGCLGRKQKDGMMPGTSSRETPESNTEQIIHSAKDKTKLNSACESTWNKNNY